MVATAYVQVQPQRFIIKSRRRQSVTAPRPGAGSPETHVVAVFIGNEMVDKAEEFMALGCYRTRRIRQSTAHKKRRRPIGPALRNRLTQPFLSSSFLVARLATASRVARAVSASGGRQ
jgi:hypothetical protein